MPEPHADYLGKTHEPAPDARVLSLVPSLTELMFDLGLAGAEDAASIIVNGQTAAVDVMAISAVDQPEASFQAASNPWHFISSGCAALARQRSRLK